MTKAAQLFLVLTGLAPIAFVYAAVQVEHKQYALAATLGVVVVFLVLLCYLLLRGVEKQVTAVPKAVSDPSPKDSEPLAFLVAYALPVVIEKTGSQLGMVAFVLTMGLTLWQLQVFHVNPLLALLGYYFFGAKGEGGAPVLIIAKSKLLVAGNLSVVRISEYLWLHCGYAEGEHGSATRDSEGQNAEGGSA